MARCPQVFVAFLLLFVVLGPTSTAQAQGKAVDDWRVEFTYSATHDDAVRAERNVALGGTNTLDAAVRFLDLPNFADHPEGHGLWSFANNKGSFRTQLRATTGVPTGTRVRYYLLLEWRGSYVKMDETTPFFFTVTPGLLKMIDGRSTPFFSNPPLVAAWRLTAKVEGITQFEDRKRLEGKGARTANNPAARLNMFNEDYAMVEETGPVAGELDFLGEDVETPDGMLYTYYGGEYRTPKYVGRLDLSGITIGEVFEVSYELETEAIGYGGDTLAEVSIGDPLEYSGGVSAEYGEYGDVLRITQFTLEEDGRRRVQHTSEPDFYYLLHRADVLAGQEIPVDLGEGLEGTRELVDSTATDPELSAFYRVQRVHSSVPLDTDADGIDDWYELQRPGILHPLNPADALADTDGDGRTARQEYLEGTDPEIPDEPAGGDGLYPSEVFAVGGGAGLESADLNADGNVDLVSFNGTLQVSLGNPDGSFAPPNSVAIPGAGTLGDITLGDLNGDDFPDLVFADQLNNRVQVELGDGSGGFSSAGQHDLGAAPSRAVLVFANNDAHLDIVALNNNARSVSLLLGNGDGTFQAPTTLTTTDRPTDAVAVPLNDDAHPDLAVALETGGGWVAVLLSNGDGTYAPAVNYDTGASPQRLAAGDLNGDGWADIITSNQTGDGVSVLLSNGDGTLQAKVDHSTGDNPRGLVLTDLDGDTDLDVLVAHLSANYHALLLNDGSGGFAPAQSVPTGSGNHTCVVVDVDRDGRLDIVSRVGNETAMVSRGLPNGAFDTRTQINFPPGFTPRELQLADVNGDDRLDFAIANGGNNNSVEILLGQETGEFQALPSLAVGANVEALALDQFNADPDLDVAVVTQRPEFFPGSSSNQLHVLHGDGLGAFTPAQVVDLHAAPKRVLTGDFDGDGLKDLLIAFDATGELQWFANSGTEFVGNTPVKLANSLNANGGLRILENFDGNGKAAIAAVVSPAFGQGLIHVLQPDAQGQLSAVQVITPENSGQAQSLVVYDWDADGRLDLLATVISGGQPSLVLYPQTTAGTFGAEQLLLAGGGASLVADLNADGLPDLVSGATIRLAEAGGTFASPKSHHLPGSFVFPVQVADLNGDGRPDLISAEDLTDNVSILLHR